MTESELVGFAGYVAMIKKALKAAGTYSTGVEAQITAAAGALRTLEIANAEIDSLTSTTVLETTKTGSKVVPHPAFKVQRDAADCLTKQLRQLGLTTEDLGGGDRSDPLVQLTDRLIKAPRKKAPTIIKPEPGDDR